MNTTTATTPLGQFQFQDWASSIYVLLLTGLAVGLYQLLHQPAFPKNAPRALTAGSWPVLGTLRFFSERAKLGLEVAKLAQPVSFYIGKFQIVGLSGIEGRKAFFESKDLNMAEGYAVLLNGQPAVEGGPSTTPNEAAGFSTWFSRTITRMLRKENFVKNLPTLITDSEKRLQAMIDKRGGAKTGIMDPFDDIYRIIYQLTIRTIGATEIAESPELFEKTLSMFEIIEGCDSPTRIIFPWFPTPNHLKRMSAGAQLYMVFNRLIEDRKKSGKRIDDPLQFLMDTGEPTIKILTFVLGALFAGILNSSVNAAWLLIYLATNREWYHKIRDEVDAVVARHRTSPTQTAVDVLGTLSVDEWESEFPLIDLGLRESIRLQLVGTFFRRNISGTEIPIGDTGKVIPHDAFAVYWADDVHMHPDIYANPARFDPGRYLPDRAEDKKRPLGYVGWGVGRHVCLGMKFAKLEMAIIGAMFVSMFDYELVDPVSGERIDEAPEIERDRNTAGRPKEEMRLRYTVREA